MHGPTDRLAQALVLCATGGLVALACSNPTADSATAEEMADGGATDALATEVDLRPARAAMKEPCSKLVAAAAERRARCGVWRDSQLSRGGAAATFCVNVLTAPGMDVAPSEIEACASAIAALPCDENEDIPACAALAKQGTLADGDPCWLGQQCASGNCDGGTFNRCGTCVPALSSQSGCKSSNMASLWFGPRSDRGNCAAGLVCGTRDSRVQPGCEPIQVKNADEPCEHVGAVCAPGLACVALSNDPPYPPWTRAAASCKPWHRVGETCGAGVAACAGASQCRDGRCRLAIGGEGEPCTTQVGNGLVTSEDCAAGFRCSASKCTAFTPGAVGEACPSEGASWDGACATGLYCRLVEYNAGQCTAITKEGESCTDSRECEAFAFCLPSQCQTPSFGVCL